MQRLAARSALLRGTWFLGLALALCGCTSQFQGVPLIVDSAGAVQAPANARGTVDPTLSAETLDLRQRFRAHASLAIAPGDDQPARVAQMVRSGALLARANCDDFFTNAALLQQRMNVSRDLVAPVISVLTNILALQSLSDGNHDDYLKILSIGSSAVLAGITIVDQHFLFSAENIKEVRDLTFQALDAHEQAIGELGVLTFEDGIQQLIDHQVICTPASILGLTKQAIAAGQVSAVKETSAELDDEVLAKLGSALGLTGPATPKQAAVLWALYRLGLPADGIPSRLAADLKQNSLGKLVETVTVADGAPALPAKLSAEGSAKASQVMDLLKSFSGPTQATLAQAAASVSEGRSSIRDAQVILPTTTKSRSVRLVVH